MKGYFTLKEVNRIANQPYNSIYNIEESELKPGNYIVQFKLGSQAFINELTYLELIKQ